MLNHTSTLQFESTSTPGVTFVIRRWTYGMRLKLRRELAETNAKLREVADLRDALLAEVSGELGKPGAEVLMSDLSPKQRSQFASMLQSEDLIHDTEIGPAHFGAGFVSVDGIKIDGEEVTSGQQLQDHGPLPLYQEILRRIFEEAGLTAVEKENLKSPTTSAAAEGGQTNDTTAASAGGNDSTSDVSAGSSQS